MTRDEQRKEAVRLMKSREKRNEYTNGSKRQYFFGYPNEGDDGYSDCSSAVRECIRRAAGIYIGSNTNAQIKNLLAGKGKLIDAASGGRVLPDEAKLLPGDCLYFKGNTSHVRAVGHVEMYAGPNECWGHGSGIGPNRHDLKKYCENRGKSAKTRYLCAVRWIPDDEETPVPDLTEYETVTGGEWPVYATLPAEPEIVGTVNAGDELRVFGERDGYYAIRSADGTNKGWVRKEAFESAAEEEQE